MTYRASLHAAHPAPLSRFWSAFSPFSLLKHRVSGDYGANTNTDINTNTHTGKMPTSLWLPAAFQPYTAVPPLPYAHTFGLVPCFQEVTQDIVDMNLAKTTFTADSAGEKKGKWPQCLFSLTCDGIAGLWLSPCLSVAIQGTLPTGVLG